MCRSDRLPRTDIRVYREPLPTSAVAIDASTPVVPADGPLEAGVNSPTVTLSGALADLARWQLVTPGTYDLDIDAEDGDLTPPAGIEKAEVLLDGERVGEVSEECAEPPCSLSTTVPVPISVPDGRHSLEVVATSLSGATGTAGFDLAVDAGPPDPVASVSLAGNSASGARLEWERGEETDVISLSD